MMRPGSANGVPSSIAADGMSGPWPEGSKAIPQKHDQSPAPPPSSQKVGETKVMPPVAALVPSPMAPGQGQQRAGEQSVVPVKKMVGVDGVVPGGAKEQ